MNLKNVGNEYAFAAGPDVFERAPKTVWAALAVSFASNGGDYIDEVRDRIVREWWILHENGIVPQKPPFPKPAGERP